MTNARDDITTHTLTSGEADSITDYNELFLYLTDPRVMKLADRDLNLWFSPPPWWRFRDRRRWRALRRKFE